MQRGIEAMSRRTLALAVLIQLVQIAIWTTPGCTIFGFTTLAVPAYLTVF